MWEERSENVEFLDVFDVFIILNYIILPIKHFIKFHDSHRGKKKSKVNTQKIKIKELKVYHYKK